MAHANWCGKPCESCEKPCSLDEAITCSPDCPELSADGTPAGRECRKCDAYVFIQEQETD